MVHMNDFSITDLQMMESTDGYAIRCNLLYKGEKLGVFFNKGDGGDYYFYPEKDISQQDVEDMLTGEDFKPIESPFTDTPPINWNLGILVEKLIEYYELRDQIVKAKESGNDLVVIDNMKNGTRSYVNFQNLVPNDAINLYVKMNFGTDVTWKRY